MINIKPETVLHSQDYHMVSASTNDYRIGMAIDNVIFGYHDKSLKVLLIKNPLIPVWMLPGGYIRKTESAEEASARVALQRTGLKDLFLQQFKVFSNPERNQDPYFTPELIREWTGLAVDKHHWMFQPVVSISFYTLTEFSKVVVSGSYLEEECQWVNIDALPEMFQDHKTIIKEALKALRLHIQFYPIGYELLPDKFTLPEIHSLYETILGKQMDDRNFTRKLMSLGIIVKLNEVRKVKGHRAPYLYQFEKVAYQKALEEGTPIT